MNILTFDVEEWFHILDNDSTLTLENWKGYQYRLEENMDRIFNVLYKYNQNATFFVLGWVAREFPSIVQKISDQGFDIASHSDMHQLVYTQTRSEFADDLERSIKSIEDITGVKVDTYRAPGFSLNASNTWAFEELIGQGIRIDCSIFPASRAHGGFEEYGRASPGVLSVNGANIKEFPINIYQFLGINVVFSGGGYFRLMPYNLIKKLTKSSEYVMTYFHPRDFDAGQPVIKELSLARKFKSYYGLASSLSKLDMLLRDFEFVSLAEADGNVDWDAAPIKYI